MWIPSHRSSTGAGRPPALLVGVALGCAALILALSSCGPATSSLRLHPPSGIAAVPPRYSIICVIHGDGDYLYHDPGGYGYRADEVALARAISVAQKNPAAEVFIFHEKPREHFLLFFPVRDGWFACYRNGRLVAEETYWRDGGTSRFDQEAGFYEKYRDNSGPTDRPPPLSFFLYFGHEIPEVGGAGYDDSYQDRAFDIGTFAEEVHRFTPDSGRFDLLLLSTCYGGTPHTIASLSPAARTIIASPDNLHLSYFDLGPFEHLERTLRDGDVQAFATSFARHAFDRLAGSVQTAVTIGVYDVDRVAGYVSSVDSIYERTLTATMHGGAGSAPERCDCADDPSYVKPGMNEGLDIFYRPPRFGRAKSKESHSGWECLKVNRP